MDLRCTTNGDEPDDHAIILYLYVGQFLSKKRTAAALVELFGTPVSEGIDCSLFSTPLSRERFAERHCGG